MDAFFERIPREGTCDYCSGRRPTTPLPPPLDAVYCISLQEQPHRTRKTSEHFHHIGLCRHVTFYRPTRAANTDRGVWESHRAVAHHALAQSCRSALILEDDVTFRRNWEALAPRLARAFAQLPADWRGLFLGHFAWQAYFVRRRLLRTRSTCLHAYVAGPRLLTWLAETRPFAAEVPLWSRIGLSLDSATANLPGMYALFPMPALQRNFGDPRIDAKRNRHGRRRAWNDVNRWRYYGIFRGALAAEALAVLLSPFHWLTLERFCRNVDTALNRDAARIRAAGLFDDAFYLETYPDVARAGVDPLRHYLTTGAGEGRKPRADAR